MKKIIFILIGVIILVFIFYPSRKIVDYIYKGENYNGNSLYEKILKWN